MDRARDRPRCLLPPPSRLDDLKLPSPSPRDRDKTPSYPRFDSLPDRPCSDRSPSDKAPPAALSSSTPRAPSGFDRDCRESWRKAHSAERDNGDVAGDGGVGDESFEKAERGRNSFRKGQGYEREGIGRSGADRYFSSKFSDRDRSERSDGSRTPSRKPLEHDRPNFDKVETPRSSGRRSYGSDYRQEIAESTHNSPSRDERESKGTVGTKSSRRSSASDKERHERGDSYGKVSSSSGRDGVEGCDLRRSPSSKVAGSARDGKEVIKLPPKRSHGCDRDELPDLGKGSPRKQYVMEKDAIKISPKKEYGTERDSTRTPRLSPRKAPELEKDAEETQKFSPRKSNGTDKDSTGIEEIRRVSPKSKYDVNKGDNKSGLTLRGHESSSDEGDTGTGNRSSSSRARKWAQDPADETKLPGAHGCQEDGWRKKRLRSDRDRGRREDKAQSVNVVQQDDFAVKVEEIGQKSPSIPKLDTQVATAEEGGGNVDGKAKDAADQVAHVSPGKPDVTGSKSDEIQSDPVESSRVPESYSISRVKSEMEEGELEPEEETGKETQKEVENKDSIGKNDSGAGMEVEKSIAGDDESHGYITNEEEMRKKVLVEAENQLHESGSGAKSDENQQELCERLEHGEPKEIFYKKEENRIVRDNNDNMDLKVSKTDLPSTSKEMELGERYKGELTLDLLQERASAENVQAEQGNSISGEKDCDPNRELTLSLCTKPVAAAARFKQNGLLPISQNNLSDKFENQECVRGALSMRGIDLEKDLAAGVEEFGEHLDAGYGHKHKKLKIDSLQLSLAPPEISLVPSRPNPPHLAGPVEPERSVQSLTLTQTQTQNLSVTQTHTNSDGFTNSFTQSHSFVHNPSCSLNCNSFDNQELSCGGSRQISQGNEQMSNRSWQTPSANEQLSNGAHGVTSLSQDRWKNRHGMPLYQRILQNGNMQPHRGFPSVTGSVKSSGSNQIPQQSHQIGQRLKVPDTSLQDIKTLEKKVNIPNDMSERAYQQEARVVLNKQFGSRDMRSEPHLPLGKESLRDFSEPPTKRFSTVRNEDVPIVRNLYNERIGLHEIAIEPVTVMAQKLQELPDSFLDGLKDLAKEMLGSFEKRGEFITLQEILQRRTDLTEDTLLRAHRTQLEILVAIKTGLQSFVQKDTKPLTYKALIEIFLQIRCRNIDCQQSLPVDRCECKICSQKSGFCSECMCVVCSKFDSDNQTCRWVGCDLCEHWCHTDCGLRLSYILPAPSNQGGSSSEMQFKCVACGHNLELFGFVKDVFRKCSDAWGAETLAKELDCVRRIFHGSEDMKGMQLCWKAEQTLQKLENKVDVKQVCRSVLQFFNEGNALHDGAHTSAGKQPHTLKPNEASAHVVDAANEAVLKMKAGAGNEVADLDKARAALKTYDKELEDKRTEVAELQYVRARKKAEIEDFESMVRMKQAEAKMFQTCADEARLDANGLQCIAAVKRGKVDEDYACKYAKLRLEEAEDKRRKWLEEVQALERVQNDFRRMKAKTETEIKDLLMKMELTKRHIV